MRLSRAGIALSDWFERWFPDAFVFAAIAVAAVLAASVLAGNSPLQSAVWFGAGFWDLTRFTMQMAMIIVSGYVVAASAPVYRAIRRLAAIPDSPPAAAAFVALFSMFSSLLSWSFSLIFSGLLAREVARKVQGSDYRALGAAAYMGLGSVWALGLSSSAALIMASPGSMPESLLKISGVIPFGQTLLLWQSLLLAAVLMTLSAAVAYWSAPAASEARNAESLGVPNAVIELRADKPGTPGEWLECGPWLNWILGLAGVAYLAQTAAFKGPQELLDLNNYIFAFLVAGLLLHASPRSFMKAVSASVPAAAGVLIQYPLYAGILKVLTESGLSKALAHAFVAVSSRSSFPLLVGVYSAVLGLFVPSAGGKWLIEAPYLLEAAKTLQVHLGWVVQAYNAAEALPNLIHPFWMLPLLGILNLKARDIVGYCSLQFVFHVPLVLLWIWAFNYTLTFAPPLSAR